MYDFKHLNISIYKSIYKNEFKHIGFTVVKNTVFSFSDILKLKIY